MPAVAHRMHWPRVDVLPGVGPVLARRSLCVVGLVLLVGSFPSGLRAQCSVSDVPNGDAADPVLANAGSVLYFTAQSTKTGVQCFERYPLTVSGNGSVRNDSVADFGPTAGPQLIRTTADDDPYRDVSVVAADTTAVHPARMSLRTTAEVLGVTALGSAVSAGVEGVVSGHPLLSPFERDFDISAGFLAFLAGAGELGLGGGFAGGGSNGPFQWYVCLKGPPLGIETLKGGFTLGGAAVFTEDPAGRARTTTFATLFEHELGHILQFVALSGLVGFTGRWVPFGPWIPYVCLGAPGLMWPNNPWENFASWLGHAVAS